MAKLVEVKSLKIDLKLPDLEFITIPQQTRNQKGGEKKITFLFFNTSFNVLILYDLGQMFESEHCVSKLRRKGQTKLSLVSLRWSQNYAVWIYFTIFKIDSTSQKLNHGSIFSLKNCPAGQNICISHSCLTSFLFLMFNYRCNWNPIYLPAFFPSQL